MIIIKPLHISRKEKQVIQEENNIRLVDFFRAISKAYYNKL